MFCVRDIKPADLSQVFEFTVKLLRHHIGQRETSLLGEVDLSQLFTNGFLNGFLLVQTANDGLDECRDVNSEKEKGPIGFMIFHTEVSLTRGGRGILLDQFYIEPDFRRLGLGHLMMSVLCKRVLASGGNYIKLVYQDGLGLEPVYSRMGFVNHSKGKSGLHLFEAYGEPKLQEFLELAENNARNPTSSCDTETAYSANCPRPHVLMIPLPPPANQSLIPTWSTLSNEHRSSFGTEEALSSFPGTRLVIVSDRLPPNLNVPSNSSANEDLSWLHPRICLFLEQCSICSWLGPMVNFSDFIGDTGILDTGVLLRRVQSWVHSSSQIKGAVWEVPTGICPRLSEATPMESPAMTPSNASTLAATLSHLDVPDDTSLEGWNIVYLDKTGMQKLVETRPRKGLDRWCTCRRIRLVRSGFR